MKVILNLFAMVCILCCTSVYADAHRLNVFAWLDNDQIVVECNFGKDKPAINATVFVIDAVTNKEILDGHTTSNGSFSFPVPDIIRQGHNLLIRVNAGQGHSSEWTVESSELYAAASLAAGFEDAALGEQKASRMKESAAGLTTEQLRAVIQAELQNHLGPIHQQIAQIATKGPTMVEIIGGIGWIIGLAGIGMYFKNRKPH